FKEDESNLDGPYSWVRFRRQEQAQNQNWTRLVTLSHAPAEQAFLADVYLVSRTTQTRTPVARELRRYGDAAEAEVAARELVARGRGWLGAQPASSTEPNPPTGPAPCRPCTSTCPSQYARPVVAVATSS